MSEKITIVIQLDGNYPDISSGIVSFENSKTGRGAMRCARPSAQDFHQTRRFSKRYLWYQKYHHGFWRRLYYTSRRFCYSFRYFSTRRFHSILGFDTSFGLLNPALHFFWCGRNKCLFSLTRPSLSGNRRKKWQ